MTATRLPVRSWVYPTRRGMHGDAGEGVPHRRCRARFGTVSTPLALIRNLAVTPATGIRLHPPHVVFVVEVGGQHLGVETGSATQALLRVRQGSRARGRR